MKTRYTQPKKTSIKGKQLQGTHIPAMIADTRRNNSGYGKNIFSPPRKSDNSNKRHQNTKWIHWLLIILVATSGLILLKNRDKIAGDEVKDSNQSNISNDSDTFPSLSISAHIPEILADIQEQIELNITNDLCQMPVAKILCKGNLGVNRDQMPQLSDEILENYLNQARQNRVVVKSLTVPARNLVPAQAQLHAVTIFKKHLQAKENSSSNPCKKDILVASDPVTGVRYIIDGHHTAMGCMLADGDQQIKSVSQTARKTLDDLKIYSGVETSSLPFFVNTPKVHAAKDVNEVHSVSRPQRKS